MTQMCKQKWDWSVSDTRDIVDRQKNIAPFCIPTQFSSALGCFKTITQLLDSDWPNI